MSISLLNCLMVGLGGAIGSILRYLMGLIPVKNPAGFPILTFLINIFGAFLIGTIVAYSSKNLSLSPRMILFLKVGVCGGFTTFSTFSLESLQLIKSGNSFIAIIYMISSVILSVLAVMLGHTIVK